MLIIVKLTLTKIQGHGYVRKQKHLRQISHKVFSRFDIKGRDLYLCDFIKKKKKNRVNTGLYSDIYRPISFKLGVMIETTKFCSLISVWVTLIFIQNNSLMRNQNIRCLFDKFSTLPQPVGFLKLMLNSFCTSSIIRERNVLA